VLALAESHAIGTVALSGGVGQNLMLVSDLTDILERQHLSVWCNRAVPANDGGISLGHAALAAVADWR
jgi:hydrogenase maturation protein HypF